MTTYKPKKSNWPCFRSSTNFITAQCQSCIIERQEKISSISRIVKQWQKRVTVNICRQENKFRRGQCRNCQIRDNLTWNDKYSKSAKFRQSISLSKTTKARIWKSKCYSTDKSCIKYYANILTTDTILQG